MQWFINMLSAIKLATNHFCKQLIGLSYCLRKKKKDSNTNAKLRGMELG